LAQRLALRRAPHNGFILLAYPQLEDLAWRVESTSRLLDGALRVHCLLASATLAV
jgi:hypothetical protein